LRDETKWRTSSTIEVRGLVGAPCYFKKDPAREKHEAGRQQGTAEIFTGQGETGNAAECTRNEKE